MLRRADYARRTLAARARRAARCTTSRSPASSPWRSTRRSRPSSSGARPRASTPATRSAASTPSTPTACWWRSPSGARGRTSTAWPTSWAGRSPPSDRPPWRGRAMSVAVQTPQQREDVVTIYERSRPGRRAFTAPALDVPEVPHRRPAAPLAAPRRPARAARGGRAGDRAPLQPPQQAQLRPRHRLLPAGVVHDEAQPQAPRAGGRAARATPACTPSRRPRGPRGPWS